MIQLHDLFPRHTKPYLAATFTEKLFIVRKSLTAPIYNILNLFYKFKSEESPGHSNTDIPLISRMCFVFCASFIGLLNSLKRIGISNIMKRRCETLPNNTEIYLMNCPFTLLFCAEEQIMKLYDEKASQRLGSMKARVGNTVFNACLPH